jgi:GH15 family glucan-1,4-alpha-glucosidase
MAAATSPSRRATTCPGYAGARPVRIGNGAFDQRQNDVFGAVLGSILLHTRRSQRLPAPSVADRPVAGRVRRRVWREPDQGIWRRAARPSTMFPRS